MDFKGLFYFDLTGAVRHRQALKYLDFLQKYHGQKLNRFYQSYQLN
jgi:hypothetical protein